MADPKTTNADLGRWALMCERRAASEARNGNPIASADWASLAMFLSGESVHTTDEPRATDRTATQAVGELKPCPFCGGEAFEWTDAAVVECTVCDAEQHGTNPEAAIAAWNRRAKSAPEVGEGERAERWEADVSRRIAGLTMRPDARDFDALVSDIHEILRADRLLGYTPAEIVRASPVRSEGWKEIESAPKDRTSVIVACPEPRGQWAIGEARFTEGAWWWANVIPGGKYSPCAHQPTHFQPLPAPPVSLEGEG